MRQPSEVIARIQLKEREYDIRYYRRIVVYTSESNNPKVQQKELRDHLSVLKLKQ